MACMLGPNGKCVGLLTPERIHILHNAYHTTKTRGGHAGIQPPPAGFEAEVVALLQRQSSRTIDSSVSQQVKDSYTRVLPGHIHRALQKWA